MDMQKLNSANSRSRVFASPYENEAHQELYLNRCPTLQKKKKKSTEENQDIPQKTVLRIH